MQQDVSTSTAMPRGRRRGGTQETMGEKNLLEYLNDATMRISETSGHIAEQVRTKPLIYGSLILGIIGAIVGARIAQMQAMQRRKNVFERAIDTISDIGSVIAARAFGRQMGPIETLRERGREVSLGTRMLGTMGWTPMAGMPRFGMQREPRDTMSQVGYALSLIPLTIAFLRNPLVRDFGIRLLSRRGSSR
ncbi:MAG: hypothetical protein ACOX87_13625 [Chloroflexota bacterium]|jgi:uncharacterized membrane protein YeaQ/YmgE (transglycosylase-associated protein family)